MCGQKIWKGFNDLATTHPELVSEWDKDANIDLSPYNITAKSNKIVHWVCKLGHTWEAPPNRRSAGSGCPYCAGKKVWKGFNDLATTNPELVKEWDKIKNQKLTPYDVTSGSNRKVHWKCKNNHTWQSQIYLRAKGQKCPYCSGRRIWREK